MLKRIGLLFAAFILGAVPSSAQVLNPLTRTSIGGIPDCKSTRVFCVGKQAGSEYTKICGMTPGVGGANSCGDAGDVCIAGSALAAAASAGCSAATPCEIRVGPGVYNECVHFDNITDVSLVGAGQNATVIRPTVTAATDVQNGVIRFGALTTSRHNTARIDVSQLWCQNDAFSSPEACFQAGKDAGPGSGDSSWNEISIHDVVSVGAHDSIQWFGSGVAGDVDPPIIRIERVYSVGGADNIIKKGIARWLVRDSEALTVSNYCETADETFLGTIGGTVAATGTTTTIQLEAADDFGVTDGYVGRKVTLSGGACAAGHQGWITIYNTSTDVATYSPAAGFTPNTTCTYSIAPVANFVAGSPYPESPCRDIDWTPIRAQAAGDGYWKHTIVHIAGSNGGADDGRIQSLRGRVVINDYGPADPACAAQAHVAGILHYTGTSGRFVARDLDLSLDINADLRDGDTCTDRIAGISLTGDAAATDTMLIDGVTISIKNPGDADENVRGIVAEGAEGATGTLQINNAYIDIDNTVGGYAGASSHLYQTAGVTLAVGELVADVPITSSGAITLLSGASSTGSTTMDFASATAGTCSATLTMTVPGAGDGDSCAPGVPNGSQTAGSQFDCYVSAADTVTVRHCCENGTCNPASGTFRATVTRQ